MKKTLLILICGVGTLLLVVASMIVTLLVFNMCGFGTSKEKKDYPEIVYVNNMNYYKTCDVCEIVPRKAPDGYIDTFVSKEIMPDANNSANFGSEYKKLEYIFLEDNQLVVHIGENWYYFETRQQD